MPPYNYTGIEENISGFLYSTALTNTITDEAPSFYFDESCDSSKEDGKSEVDGPIKSNTNINSSNNTIKSRTLPENTSLTKGGKFIKHTRSLSESKTSDGLSLMISTNQNYGSFRDTTHRTRFNSGTDSNTSGVSSYESIYAKTLIGDLHQTLSPIPSTSNLSDVKKSSNEKFRRISLTGTSFRETSLSPQGVQGYAKLRSLRRHQRPMLSESAADELADIMLDNRNNLRLSSKLTSTRLTIGHQQRKLKVRSLDRHSNILLIG